MKKICLFGDSLSKGVIYDQIAGRYMFLKNSFAALVSGDGRLGVENYSKFGCTIGKGRDIVAKHLTAIQSADITALEFGGNDCDFDWAAISADPTGDHMPKTPISVFTDKYIELISELNEKGVRTVVINLPPIDEQRYFEWFSKKLNKENILKWLGGSVAYIYRWHELYSMQVCRIANACGVPLIDIRSSFLAQRDYSEYLCVDGIHPNEKGHRLITSAIEDYIPRLEPLFV